MLNNNPKPISIKVTKEELQFFLSYINTISQQKESINYSHLSKFFIIWHLEEMRTKIISKLFLHSNKLLQYQIKINVSLAEQKTFSVLFKYFEPSNPFILVIENKIINGLVNTW